MKKENGKAVGYLKKNAVYFILALCIIAVGLSITLMLINRENSGTNVGDEQNQIIENNDLDSVLGDEETEVDKKEPIPEVPVVIAPTYVMPVSTASKIVEYSDELVYNSTLKRFESHKAVDFFAEEGTDVFAVSSGTVVSVDNSFLEGYTITIDHGNGLKTVYNSLSENVDVAVGQKVSSGDVIGEVSITNRKENKEGAHLHFYMIENDIVINPEKYISFENK